ncbi:MAG TPA: protein kinase [Anaerolineae bacterium]|nr:protein kinase [Anaerolineae bacterium]
MTQSDKLAGKTLGKYQIIRMLGQGGMAYVYLAHDTTLGRDVALKVLDSARTTSPRFITRFQREARTAARLNQPNIVTIYEVGEIDGVNYIAMEYLPGVTLKDLLIRTQEQGRLLEINQVIAIINQIAEALTYAYETEKIVHRDVKPANVIVDETGHVTLTDFGIARAMEEDSDLTAEGGFIGTPVYMSPEHVQGHTIDHRSDVYSLGIVLYQMLVGSNPFGHTTTTGAILFKHVNEQPISPRKLNQMVSPAVEEVVLKAIAKKPEQRYRTAREMAQALTGASKKQGTASPRWAVPLVVAGLTVLVVGGSLAYWFLSTNTAEALVSSPTSATPLVTVTSAPEATPKTGSDEIQVVLATADTSEQKPITIAELSLHLGPGEIYDVVGVLPANLPLSAKARNQTADWIKIEAADGTIGWVVTDGTTIDQLKVIDLPVAVIPPTPTAANPAPVTAAATNTPAPAPTDTLLPPPPVVQAGATPTISSNETETLSANITAADIADQSAVIIDFESPLNWRRGDEPNGSFERATAQVHSKSYSGQLNYDFPTGNSDYVVFLTTLNISGTPNQVKAWVYGDGSGHYLNVWVRDNGGETRQFSFGQIKHSGWQELTAVLDPKQPWPAGHIDGPDNGKIDYPISLRALVFDDAPDSYQGAGKIYIDDITSATGSVTAARATATKEANPIVDPSPTPKTNLTGRIAFEVSNTAGAQINPGVYIMDLKTGDTSQLSGFASRPHLARQGGKVAWQNLDMPGIDWLDMSGKWQRIGLTAVAGDRDPSISNDQKRVAYISATGVYIWENALARLVASADGHPSWEPYDNWLAYTYQGFIYKVLVTDSKPVKLTLGEQPDWGPGKQIAFSRTGDIYVMDENGDALQQITNDPENDYDPTWSIDGKQIVFVSERDGNAELYVVNSDGTGLKRLTNTPYWETSPSWGR